MFWFLLSRCPNFHCNWKFIIFKFFSPGTWGPCTRGLLDFAHSAQPIVTPLPAVFFYENRCSLTGRNKSKMKIQQISVNFSLNHYLIVHVNVNVIISFTRQTNCHQALRVILTLFPLSTRTHRHTDTHTPNRLLCADH